MKRTFVSMLAMLSGPRLFGCREFVAAERKAIQSFRPADFTTAFGREEARVAAGCETRG
jgi:hypothetical protein